jgi:hypothetical protein
VGPLKYETVKPVTDDTVQSEIPNEFFASVFTVEDDPLPDIPPAPEGITKLNQIILKKEDILETLKQLKDNKAPGPDGIPTRLLKENADHSETPNSNLPTITKCTGSQPMLLQSSKKSANHHQRTTGPSASHLKSENYSKSRSSFTFNITWNHNY